MYKYAFAATGAILFLTMFRIMYLAAVNRTPTLLSWLTFILTSIVYFALAEPALTLFPRVVVAYILFFALLLVLGWRVVNSN